MKKIELLGRILFLFFTLVACELPLLHTSPSETVLPPNGFTELYETLQEENATSLTEVVLLEHPSISHRPLLKVEYLYEGNMVVGVYGNSGTVVGWKIDTTTIAFEHDIGIVTPKALVFVASGKNLIGATEHNFETNSSGQKIEYVNGLGLWDVNTGSLIMCISHPCLGTPVARDGFLGLAVDSGGKWLAVYSETGITISTVFGDSSNLYIEPVPIDNPYPWRIGSIAFDERNRRFAVVFDEGRIYLYEGERTFQYNVIAKGTEGNRLVVTDAQFDPKGQWLVIARGNTTQVLNLDNGKPLLEFAASNPVLSFDRTGEMLFVGSTNKLTIYSIEDAEKIAEYDTAGITSLFISQDNRLVIWGDMQGVIHIWARSAH